jgi:hypothetical protein
MADRGAWRAKVDFQAALATLKETVGPERLAEPLRNMMHANAEPKDEHAPRSRAFDDPIPLPGGGELVTLREAAEYIARLPKAEHDLPHWQLAMRLLIAAATRGGIVMMAEIAMRQALNHGRPPPAPKPRPRKKLAKHYKIIR